MAKMSKKISNKITKTKSQQQSTENKKKPSKDIWLIVLIAINFFLLITNWQAFILSPSSFATYVLLEIVLIIMYINRHANISETAKKWLLKTQFLFMAIILVLFICNIIIYFIN